MDRSLCLSVLQISIGNGCPLRGTATKLSVNCASGTLISTLFSSYNSFDEILPFIERLYMTEGFPHIPTSRCELYQCRYFLVADAIWSVNFAHCAAPVQVRIPQYLSLKLPVVGGWAFFVWSLKAWHLQVSVENYPNLNFTASLSCPTSGWTPFLRIPFWASGFCWRTCDKETAVGTAWVSVLWATGDHLQHAWYDSLFLRSADFVWLFM